MQLKRIITSAFTSACLLLSAHAAAAPAISDDVIRIGIITDMSSVYSDLDGSAGVEAMRMAIDEFGGEVHGKKIELFYADHQMKADIASARAREWFDQRKLDMLIGGANSAAALAMAAVAEEKKKPYIAVGGGTSHLTNKQCTPYTVHYAYDTVALARGTGAAVVENGGDSWYFLTVDYNFGHALEKDTTKVINENGGEVKGRSRVPLGTSDFSSFVLQAQSSKAKILGLANVGGDLTNTIKAANEFGVNQSMTYAGLLIFVNDVHALGLPAAQGMYLTTPWYWDLSDETRAWASKFEERVKRKPNMVQAANYSATRFYLEAVEATGTDDGDTIMEWMKNNKVNDMFVTDGYVRKDGRMINDVYLAQVKTPSESKGEWDYYNILNTMPGEDVYTTPEESECYLWNE